MTVRVEPCLSVANLKELIPRLPDNVYVQQLTVEACRVSKKDRKRPEATMFEIRQAYPNLYIPSQMMVFSTPLWKFAPRSHRSTLWKDFTTEVEAADRLCREFEFENQDVNLKDTFLSDRLYIKEIMLLELPIHDPNYHSGPYMPQDDDDKFYDGVRCAYALFSGSYQLIGAGTQEQRDGWLPGMTRKPMDLDCIQIVRTKHIRGTRKKKNWKAFHRGDGDIHTEEAEALLNDPGRVSQWLPTLTEKGLIIWREIEGEWKPSKKFVAERVSLRSMFEEESV